MRRRLKSLPLREFTARIPALKGEVLRLFNHIIQLSGLVFLTVMEREVPFSNHIISRRAVRTRSG